MGGTLVAALARALACQSTSARSYNEVTFALYTQVFEAVENHQHLSLVPQSKDWDDFLPCIKRNSLPSETATLSGVDQIQLQNSSLSLVASRSKSDYHWQSESQILFNSSGSVVASVEKISSLPATIESHQSRMALAVNNRTARLIQLSPKRQSFWSGDRLKIDFEFPENRINSVVYFDATGRSSFLVKSRVSYEKQTEEMTVNVTPPFGHETLVLMSDSLDEPNRELWAQLHQEPILLDDLLNALDEIKASSLRTDAETFLTLEKP